MTSASRRLVLLAGLGWALGACSMGHDLDALAPNPVLATASPCTTGQSRECHTQLGEHAGVLTCYHGVQHCSDGAWGDCIEGSVESIAVSEGSGSRGTGLRVSSISPATDCENSPCDPYCRTFQEVPDAGGITTFVASGSGFAWQTGSLASYPQGLVQKGLVEPCSTGSDCQFNTYCKFPDNGTCGHSKCASGDALEEDCDPCVEEICVASPECCVAPEPEPCEHDPCATGGDLDEECSDCVAAICAVQPSCCASTGAWDASCVAAVASVCDQTCGCCVGEQGFADHCYNLETDAKHWSNAQSACENRTASGAWDLVSVGNQSENDFIEDWNGSSHTWVGLEQGDGATENQWRWTNADPAGPWLESTGSGMYDNFASGEPDGSDDCTRMNASQSGTWDATSCTGSYGSICEGLPECIDGVPPPPAPCAHDPCAAGVALVAECNDCVGQICAAMPSCCTTSWTAACVSEVENTCQNVCQCGADEDEYDGHCYYKGESNLSWSSARSGCQAYRDGWDIAGVADDAENTFINTNVIDSSETWVGFTDSTSEGTWVWASGTPAGSYQIAGSASSNVISYGASWKYLANNTDPGATWNTVGFNDAAWSTGNAQLGFGDGDEATVFAKNGPSYYFRNTFTLTALPSAGSLNALFDDGYVAYVNGTEVARENVTNIAHNQYATASAENQTETGSISTTPFVVGSNVLAILVKMRNAGDGDLSFNAQLALTLPVPASGIYQNFALGEPNDSGDCAKYGANNIGSWADEDCASSYDSVCEGPYAEMIESGPRLLTGNGNKVAIPLGDIWHYEVSGTSPGATWADVAFDDSGWAFGAAQLGFGDGDEATSFAAADPSYYFRRTLNIETAVTAATLSLTFDDGFIAYVNGTQVLSHNASNSAHSAQASAGSGDNEVLTSSITTAPFVVGSNVIAVMVKNRTGSSDVSFDLQLDLTLGGEVDDGSSWGDACVSQVASVCDAICDTGEPPLDTGICTPWYPQEVDPDCSGIDLAVGVPCDDSIPVCNHGNTEAPAGIRLVHFPANSQQYPSCSPDQSHPQMVECFTEDAIPPGECVNVTTCPDLIGNREIMVNPAGDGHVDECSCRDNWGLYNASECGPPACSGGTSVATLTKKPVDVIILIDNSGSMAGEIAAVQDRINQDFSDIIAASGLDYRVILMSRYGDVDVAVGGSDHPICIEPPLGGNACLDPTNEPLVNNPPAFYHFSTDVQSLDAWCRVLEGWNNPDELASDVRPWTAVAPTGLQELLRPEAFKEFLVISDDRINCTYGGHTFDDNNSVATGTSEAAEFDAALLSLSSAQFGTAQDRNYVWHSIVGMAANSPATEPWPSSAAITTSQCSPGSEAAGTGHQALSVLTGGLRYPSCQNDNFDAMFQALAQEIIDGAELSCSFELANQEAADPNRTTVVFTSGAGDSLTFDKVDNADDCSDQEYYYEDADTVVLCPEACETVQGDANGRIAVEVSCLGAGFESRVYGQTYEAVCPDGSRPQWGFFAYDTQTPGDSSVTFRARVALSQEALADAEFVDWAVATASPDTQVCGMSGPVPCPIDIYETMGGVAQAHFPWLELEVTLTPSSGGTETPIVEDWQFTYSCLPSE